MGRKFLAPPYYSQHSVCISLSAFSFYREFVCVCVISDLAFDVQLASMSVCQLAGRGELSMLRRVLNGEHVFSNIRRLTECKWH